MQPLTRRLAGGFSALAVSVIPLLGSAPLASAAVSHTPSSVERAKPARGYVALGDSFSSGEGTGVYTGGTDTATNHCHRSPLAYPSLLKATTPHLGRLTFVACSGAVTADLYATSTVNAGQGPQLDALRRRTKAVSLTIGGNDVVFGYVAKTCVQSVRTTGFGCSKSAALNALIATRLAALAGTPTPGTESIVPVRKILADISTASPRAKIYLGGYPELFGDTDTHYSVDDTAPSGSSCVVNPALTARVDFDDAVWINARTRALNDVLQTAVAQARHDGIRATFVPATTFDGHGLCDAKLAWIQPVRVVGTTIASESLHPTAVGQRNGYARAFRRAGL